MKEVLELTPREAEALVRLLEQAPRVQRRHQFFAWTQSQLQTLLPHKVLVCGTYQRQSRLVVFDLFDSIALTPGTQAALTEGEGALLRSVVGEWIERGGRALILPPSALSGAAQSEATLLCETCLGDSLLVHAVARPYRLTELETLFLFVVASGQREAQHVQNLEMVVPHLHSTWQRVQCLERELLNVPSGKPKLAANAGLAHQLITDRERQILVYMREGKSNPQIGEILAISPLTVKNHVQKILRKLGAANRAQAVAHAMSMNLLVRISQPSGSVLS